MIYQLTFFATTRRMLAAPRVRPLMVRAQGAPPTQIWPFVYTCYIPIMLFLCPLCVLPMTPLRLWGPSWPRSFACLSL
jgi:hypothetical protein